MSMTTPTSATLPTFADVESAAQQIAGIAHRTPVATSRAINARTGAELFFKCENLQRAGAFKFRGAYNALSRSAARRTPPRRRDLLVRQPRPGDRAGRPAARHPARHRHAVGRPWRSSARATAALRRRSRPLRSRPRGSRGDRPAAWPASERGLTLMPPYDHPHIIAGQGTAARELFEEVGALDFLFVPCGGGGLLSGSALAAHARVAGLPGASASSPRAGDDATRSFRTKTAADRQQPEDRRRRRAHAVARRRSHSRSCMANASDMTTVDDPTAAANDVPLCGSA